MKSITEKYNLVKCEKCKCLLEGYDAIRGDSEIEIWYTYTAFNHTWIFHRGQCDGYDKERGLSKHESINKVFYCGRCKSNKKK